MLILGFTLYVCTSRGSFKDTLTLTEVTTLLTVSQATLFKLQKKIGDKISEKTFQRTRQDLKPMCHHLVLIRYFNSEQLKVFKENQYSLNTYLHAEWGKEIYEPEKISPFNIRSASLNCRIEWYADCIQVCIYHFSYLQQEPTFPTSSVSLVTVTLGSSYICIPSVLKQLQENRQSSWYAANTLAMSALV